MDANPVILVVDDEPMVLQMLKTVLMTMPYKVLTATSGKQALETIDKGMPGVDLVLTDIRMPEMTGIQLQKQIHKLRPEIPVLMMTGYTDFDMVVEALRNHAFDLIFKPIDMDQLSWSLVKANSYIKHQRMEKDYLERLKDQVAEQTATLRKQLKELEEAKAAASAVDELKREFMDIISHELRTPLNGIMGATQLLEIDSSPTNVKQCLYMLQVSSESMKTLVDNLLALTQTKAMDPMKKLDQKSIENAFSKLLSRYNQMAKDKGISLETCLGGVCVMPIRAPWEPIQILAGCLLDNAIKFTNSGGKVKCNLRAEPLSPESEEAKLSLEVCDTGIGIAPEFQETIFQPFKQVEHYMTREHGGVGIGLAIVRTICEKLGGTLTLDSTPGKGSCFRCSFVFSSAGGSA